MERSQLWLKLMPDWSTTNCRRDSTLMNGHLEEVILPKPSALLFNIHRGPVDTSELQLPFSGRDQLSLWHGKSLLLHTQLRDSLYLPHMTSVLSLDSH